MFIERVSTVCSDFDGKCRSCSDVVQVGKSREQISVLEAFKSIQSMDTSDVVEEVPDEHRIGVNAEGCCRICRVENVDTCEMALGGLVLLAEFTSSQAVS